MLLLFPVAEVFSRTDGERKDPILIFPSKLVMEQFLTGHNLPLVPPINHLCFASRVLA